MASIPEASGPAAHPGAQQPHLKRNVYMLGGVSFFTDVASEMIYPFLPVFLRSTLGASAGFIGAIEGAAESTASLLKLGSGWWSDRVRRRKPLVVFGYGLAAIMRPLVALAQSAGHVMVIRVSDRVGKGIRTSPRDAMIADSVPASQRGRAFGFHRASDHAGAVFGPLIAYALVEGLRMPLRTVFLLAAVPGTIALVIAIVGVKEPPVAPPRPEPRATRPLDRRMGGRFWGFLGAILLFTLGNSTDAFLLLRASDLGVPTAALPILWAYLHVVKSASSVPGGMLSDRIGRKPALLAGWVVFAVAYAGFASATTAWHVWALFAVYGLFFGLTEGAQRALVADMVVPEKRGTAFGWFHLAVGLGALPASVLFGLIWDRVGPHAAFLTGGSLAIAAAVVLMFVVPGGRAGVAPGDEGLRDPSWPSRPGGVPPFRRSPRHAEKLSPPGRQDGQEDHVPQALFRASEVKSSPFPHS